MCQSEIILKKKIMLFKLVHLFMYLLIVSVQRTCGESSAYNNTYFINSGFPSTVSGGTQCTFTIIPCPNICQVRDI